MSAENEFDPRILQNEKERLSELPYIRRSVIGDEPGVLLSDKIEQLCTASQRLISPFDRDSLRPAGYDLRVGLNYAIGKKRNTLNLGEKLTIGPYQVAVIQTLETLNLPEFLIGRWNIRVKLAYKGLLWVGGAQVDPGFRGQLSCPIYNLSTEPVELECGERLAMIDFVTTTKFVDEASIPFQWWNDKKLVFPQYRTDLCSGVESRLLEIQDRVEKEHIEVEKQLKDHSEDLHRDLVNTQIRIDTRIDTFLTLVFTVVAVLFAGLGIVATKGTDESSFVSSPVWVAAVALYFALKPYAIAWSESRRGTISSSETAKQAAPERQWLRTLKPKFAEVFAASIIVVGSVAFNIFGAHLSARRIANQGREIHNLQQELDREKYDFDLQIKSLNERSEAHNRNQNQERESTKSKRK